MAPSRAAKDKESKESRVLANRYEVLRKLGSGNFGTAFQCKDRKNNNEFKVLKEISVGDLQPDETVDAMHEARLLSKLDHPGIVQFQDSFIDGEFFCIITEYCEGGDLDHKIQEYKKKGKHFQENEILNWIVQLILAVQYMHSRRVLHRDLKTRNIFIRNNMMKIGDFGISRILMGTMDMASTFTGTPYYMSPEVLKHEGYNSKSDVWSIGCILYELCSLEHAFMGQGLMAVMYKIVEKEPPDLPKKYSRELDNVFKTMLTKEPEKRPSATEVTKHPYVARHMAKMKDLLTDEFKSKHNINPETAEFEAKELAVLLEKKYREKSHMGDLRSTMDSTRSSESEDSDQNATVVPAKPKLTARERLRLKKMQEADRRANDLNKAAKIQLVENSERRDKIQSSIGQATLPAWKGGYGEGTQLKQAINVRDSRLDHTPSEWGTIQDHHYLGYSLPQQGQQHPGYDSSGDEELTVKQQSISRRSSERAAPKSNTMGSDNLRRSAKSAKTPKSFKPPTRSPRTLTNRSVNTLSMTMTSDDRPITPMRDRMVYGREHSSLDFKDGIPEQADLAETYYEQFNEFDDDDADIVVGGAEADSDSEEEGDEDGTLVQGARIMGQDEEEDFINYLEMALDKDDAESTTASEATITDDSVNGAFGPTVRETKIRNIKAECVRMMGQDEFSKAYNYLKAARGGQEGKEKSEKEIMEGLRKYVRNPSDCFMVDQLLFLEEQAKLSLWDVVRDKLM